MVMKREFNIQDVAHMSKGKRVRGILNYNQDNESYKDFTLKFKDEVKIIGYIKGDEKICGGYVYDCEVEYKGIIYRVESISQLSLYPKKMWEQNVEMERRIKELKGDK